MICESDIQFTLLLRSPSSISQAISPLPSTVPNLKRLKKQVVQHRI